MGEDLLLEAGEGAAQIYVVNITGVLVKDHSSCHSSALAGDQCWELWLLYWCRSGLRDRSSCRRHKPIGLKASVKFETH